MFSMNATLSTRSEGEGTYILMCMYVIYMYVVCKHENSIHIQYNTLLLHEIKQNHLYQDVMDLHKSPMYQQRTCEGYYLSLSSVMLLICICESSPTCLAGFQAAADTMLSGKECIDHHMNLHQKGSIRMSAVQAYSVLGSHRQYRLRSLVT